MTGGRILLVDDELRLRQVMRYQLERRGYDVTEAADGEAALAAVAAEPPDLILLDLIMPGMTGYEVCRRLKGHDSTRLIPIIIVTALDTQGDKLRLLELGADDFLNKPVNMSELTTRVRSLISLKRYTDELEQATLVLTGIARAVELRDPYTFGHGQRVADGCVRLARSLRRPEDEVARLRQGALLHDLGKIAVPDEILHKPGPLCPDEEATIHTHAAIGADLVSPMRSLHEVAPLIRHHHERLDGSGYPDGLTSRSLGVAVRILAVVDVFDALTTGRSYRAAFAEDAALEMLRAEARRGRLDRELVDEWTAVLAARPGVS